MILLTDAVEDAIEAIAPGAEFTSREICDRVRPVVGPRVSSNTVAQALRRVWIAGRIERVGCAQLDNTRRAVYRRGPGRRPR